MMMYNRVFVSVSTEGFPFTKGSQTCAGSFRLPRGHLVPKAAAHGHRGSNRKPFPMLCRDGRMPFMRALRPYAPGHKSALASPTEGAEIGLP